MKKYTKEILLTLAFCLAVYIAYKSPVHCLFKHVTGIDCMSCGITRAMFSALHFNFKKAFYYHPLWFSVPITWVVLFFNRKIPKRVLEIYLLSVLAAFVTVYVLRLLFIPNSMIYIGDKIW